MNAETIFSISNNLSLVAWLFLIFLPYWKWTRYVIISGGVSLIFGALYIFLFLTNLSALPDMSDMSLAAIAQGFSDPNLALIGWIHYLAFDLFVGAWETHDAQRWQIKHIWVVPCLIFTFMFGPTGLVLYFIVKAIATRRLDVEPFG